MTKDQIIRLAKEAGIRDCTCDGDFGCLERFAALVAAHERETENQIQEQLKIADENQRIRAELKFNGIAEAEKQEPVAYLTGYYAGYPTIAFLNSAMVMNTGMALYAHPPKREPLTDEEIEQCCYQTDCKANDHPATWKWTTEFAKAIEAAHGIKGKA